MARNRSSRWLGPFTGFAAKYKNRRISAVTEGHNRKVFVIDLSVFFNEVFSQILQQYKNFSKDVFLALTFLIDHLKIDKLVKMSSMKAEGEWRGVGRVGRIVSVLVELKQIWPRPSEQPFYTSSVLSEITGGIKFV